MMKTVIRNPVAPIAINMKVITLIALAALMLLVAGIFVAKENSQITAYMETVFVAPELKIWYTEPGTTSTIEVTKNPALAGIKFSENSIKNIGVSAVLLTTELNNGQYYAESALIAPGQSVKVNTAVLKEIWISQPRKENLWPDS